jgi:hypothetical protein
MAEQTWRQYIGGHIARALDEGKAQGLDGMDLRKFVRARTHPGRAMAGAWGLKMWQQEFRHQVKGVPRKVTRGASGPIRPATGQGSLFGADAAGGENG